LPPTPTFSLKPTRPSATWSAGRLAAVEDLRRCRQRIKSFLLRYGRRYSGKSSWSAAYLNFLSTVKFPLPAQQIAFEELLNAVKDSADRIERLEAALEEQIKTWKRLPLAQAFRCFRGLARIDAITWVAEIDDFTRFDHPSQLVAFIGITPSENSSGQRRQQGAIIKTGNGACRRALIEAAWQYRLPARVTPTVRAHHHSQAKGSPTSSGRPRSAYAAVSNTWSPPARRPWWPSPPSPANSPASSGRQPAPWTDSRCRSVPIQRRPQLPKPNLPKLELLSLTPDHPGIRDASGSAFLQNPCRQDPHLRNALRTPVLCQSSASELCRGQGAGPVRRMLDVPLC
jgi:hypothetical protein